MREDQADQIIDLLSELVSEMREMNSNFNEFTSYNVYKMETVVKDLTGPTGYHMGDLHERLVEIDLTLSSIDANTTA